MNIFDSMAHPTINGYWINGKKGISFEESDVILRSNKFIEGSVVCGLPNIGGYEAELFYKKICELDGGKRFYPVAPLESMHLVDAQFEKLLNIGYRGIKIHGRIMCQEYTSEFLTEILLASSKYQMPIFICTFCYSCNSTQTPIDLYKNLISALKVSPKAKIILVHGGVHQLMLYYELIRQSENILMDISYTFMKYAKIYESVFDFLTQNLDQRLTLGSDLPEYNMDDFISATNNIFRNSSTDKINNVAHASIQRFLQLK
jgi:predicted TIM-barrel fold metal-dependent hydrolase